MSNISKKPRWDFEELVLALDLYMKHRESLPSADHPDVVELSNRLKRMNPEAAKKHTNFRNPTGVYMKLQNFRSFDSIDGGLSNGGKRDREVWELLSNNRKSLGVQAEAIIARKDVLRD